VEQRVQKIVSGKNVGSANIKEQYYVNLYDGQNQLPIEQEGAENFFQRHRRTNKPEAHAYTNSTAHHTHLLS
jgi:hypothetical protein